MRESIKSSNMYVYILVFVTVSLLFGQDLKSQMHYVVDLIGYEGTVVDESYIDKMANLGSDSDIQAMFPANAAPFSIENKVTEAKWAKLNQRFDLYKKYNATTVLAYEKGDYVTARFFIPLPDGVTNEDIVNDYGQDLMRDGYREEEENYFVKGDSSFKFIVKWERIIIVAKGL